MVALGAYAGERNLAADRAVKLPDTVTYEQAAGMMLKGMTVQYLLNRTFKVGKGMNILIHAAAGGVGLILCQWANALGANVIGTVGSQEKGARAKANGCHHTILYSTEDFVARVKEITGDALCEVAYDGIGKTTFPASLDCIKPLGMFVSLRQRVRPDHGVRHQYPAAEGLAVRDAADALNTYAAKRADLLDIANDLFRVVATGKVKIPVNQTYPLKDGAQKAHHDLARPAALHGSSILIP